MVADGGVTSFVMSLETFASLGNIESVLMSSNEVHTLVCCAIDIRSLGFIVFGVMKFLSCEDDLSRSGMCETPRFAESLAFENPWIWSLFLGEPPYILDESPWSSRGVLLLGFCRWVLPCLPLGECA